MTTFELTITLGNAEMRKPYDVTDALMAAAKQIVGGGESGNVRDTNGNTVGSWTFIEDNPDHDDAARSDRDEMLGAAFRRLWTDYDADKDENGIWPGSAADLASDVYAVYVAHGYPVA